MLLSLVKRCKGTAFLCNDQTFRTFFLKKSSFWGCNFYSTSDLDKLQFVGEMRAPKYLKLKLTGGDASSRRHW